MVKVVNSPVAKEHLSFCIIMPPERPCVDVDWVSGSG
jgi:hypothetical protein